MLMTLCPKCAEKMKTVYYISETSKPHTARCAQCILPNITTATQYDIIPKNQPRRRSKPSGPAPRDRRARYREPFRGESGGRLVTE